MNEITSVFETTGAPETFDFLGFSEKNRPDWMKDGACREYPSDWWFAGRGASTAEPKSICEGCLVREECLDYALDNNEMFGIWGGKSAKQRRTLRRRRALVA